MTHASDPARVPDPARIAARNDRFRRHACLGLPLAPAEPLGGTVVVTLGVLTLGDGFVHEFLEKVGAVTEFPPEDDPGGPHELGMVEVLGRRVWFRIDLHDAGELLWGSPAPDDPARTWRVLTVMLAGEW